MAAESSAASAATGDPSASTVSPPAAVAMAAQSAARLPSPASSSHQPAVSARAGYVDMSSCVNQLSQRCSVADRPWLSYAGVSSHSVAAAHSRSPAVERVPDRAVHVTGLRAPGARAPVQLALAARVAAAQPCEQVLAEQLVHAIAPRPAIEPGDEEVGVREGAQPLGAVASARAPRRRAARSGARGSTCP